MSTFAYFSRFQPGRPEPSRLHDFTCVPSIFNSIGLLWLRCCFGIVSCEMDPKIYQKSSQNRTKTLPKSTQNQPKTASWRGHRFLIILGSNLDPFLDPFWLHFRTKTCLKNTSNSEAKSIPKILFFCVVLATFWNSISLKNPSIFKTFRKHPFRT